MRRAYLEVGGRRHLMVFSGRAASEIEETKGVSTQEYLQNTFGNGQPKLSDLLYIASLMMRCGDAYAKREGIPNAPLPDDDELLDEIDILEDIPKLSAAIIEVITGTRHIEAQEVKNVESTQEKA